MDSPTGNGRKGGGGGGGGRVTVFAALPLQVGYTHVTKCHMCFRQVGRWTVNLLGLLNRNILFLDGWLICIRCQETPMRVGISFRVSAAS